MKTTIMKTEAAVLYNLHEPLKIEKLSIPDLKESQVLVKVMVTGICQTQLNEVKGKKGEDKYLPHTLGHEGSGIVEAVGSGVKKVKPGDHVVLTWIKGNGLDGLRTVYLNEDGSLVNSGAISTFMNFTVISENRLVKISKEISFRDAALLGCAIPTGAGIVINTARIQAGSTVAIFGVGGIGLSAVMACSWIPNTTIIAVDIHAHKLEMAKRIGATHLINAKDQNSLQAIREITKGRGVDYSIEAAGQTGTMESAFAAVRDNGGLCVIAGNVALGERIKLDPFDLIKGKRIIGTWGGESRPDLDLPRYGELLMNKTINIDKLITHEYSLGEINQAFSDLEGGKVGRSIINMNAGN